MRLHSRWTILASTVFLFGCVPSNPQVMSTFRQTPGASTTPLDSAINVQVRQVTPTQAVSLGKERQSYLDAHQIAPEDLTHVDHATINQMYVRNFRLPFEASNLQEVGVSFHKTRSPMLPNNADVIATAKLVGADTVVYATEYIGRQDHVQYVPSVTSAHASGRATATSSWGSWATANSYGSASAVTVSPMVVNDDTYINAVWFFRTSRSVLETTPKQGGSK